MDIIAFIYLYIPTVESGAVLKWILMLSKMDSLYICSEPESVSLSFIYCGNPYGKVIMHFDLCGMFLLEAIAAIFCGGQKFAKKLRKWVPY